MINDIQSTSFTNEGYCKRIKSENEFHDIYSQYENQGGKYEDLSLQEICSHFSGLIHQLKESYDAWKVNLVIKIMFHSSKNNDDYRDMFIQKYYALFTNCEATEI